MACLFGNRLLRRSCHGGLTPILRGCWSVLGLNVASLCSIRLPFTCCKLGGKDPNDQFRQEWVAAIAAPGDRGQKLQSILPRFPRSLFQSVQHHPAGPSDAGSAIGKAVRCSPMPYRTEPRSMTLLGII